MQDKRITVITSDQKDRFGKYLNPKHLFGRMLHHQELIRQFVWWEVNERYRGSYLGLLWTIIVPLLRLSVYTAVFSILLGGKKVVWGLDSNFDVGMRIFSGFILFTVFSEAVGKAPRLIWINKAYVKNIVFPIEIIPITVTGVAVVHSFIGMGVLLVLQLLVHWELNWTILYLPLVYFPLIFFVSGISWLLAAFGVFSRDINNLMQSLIQMLFLLSAIIFPLDRLIRMMPDQLEYIVRINVLSSIIEDARRIIFKAQPPNWYWLGIDMAVTLVLMLAGYACFMYFKRDFADVV